MGPLVEMTDGTAVLDAFVRMGTSPATLVDGAENMLSHAALAGNADAVAWLQKRLPRHYDDEEAFENLDEADTAQSKPPQRDAWLWFAPGWGGQYQIRPLPDAAFYKSRPSGDMGQSRHQSKQAPGKVVFLKLNDKGAPVSTMNRRALCLGAVGCATIALGGCATAVTAVTTVDEPQERTSTETVSSILVTEDKKTIVFLGKSYTYVFEAPVELISAFSAPFYSALSANMHFLVRDDRFGEFINARIVLTVADSASAEQKEAAIAAGYQKSPVTGFYDANGKFQFSDSTYSLTVRFKGKRFGATDITGMHGVLYLGLMALYGLGMGLGVLK